MENKKRDGLIVGNAYAKPDGKITVRLNNKSLKELVTLLSKHGETKLKGLTGDEAARADSIWLNLFPSKDKTFKASHVVIVYE
jgi:hypothetical protein